MTARQINEAQIKVTVTISELPKRNMYPNFKLFISLLKNMKTLEFYIDAIHRYEENDNGL